MHNKLWLTEQNVEIESSCWDDAPTADDCSSHRITVTGGEAFFLFDNDKDDASEMVGEGDEEDDDVTNDDVEDE